MENNIHKLDWGYRTESELKEIKNKISKSVKKYQSTHDMSESYKKVSITLKNRFKNMSEEERIKRNKKTGTAIKNSYNSKDEQYKKEYKKRIHDQIINNKKTYEKLKNICLKNNQKASKECLCIETNEKFKSLADAARWASPFGQGCKISHAIKTGCSAYKHPVSKIPLHWSWI